MSDPFEWMQRWEIEYLRQVVKQQRGQIRGLWQGIAWMAICNVVFYLLFLFEAVK